RWVEEGSTIESIRCARPDLLSLNHTASQPAEPLSLDVRRLMQRSSPATPNIAKLLLGQRAFGEEPPDVVDLKLLRPDVTGNPPQLTSSGICEKEVSWGPVDRLVVE